MPPASAEITPPGLLSRFVGIFWSPRSTFEGVAAHPRWVGMFLLIVGVSVVCGSVLLSTDVGQRALMDQQVRAMEEFGITVTDEQYAQVERLSRSVAVFQPAATVVSLSVLSLVVAGSCSSSPTGFWRRRHVSAGLCRRRSRGRGVGASTTLRNPFELRPGRAGEPGDVGRVRADARPCHVSRRLLNAVDLFFVWWVMLLSIGIAVICGRKTAPIAMGLFLVYGALAVAIAVVRTLFAA